MSYNAEYDPARIVPTDVKLACKSPVQWLEAGIVLLRLGFHQFLRRLRKVLDKTSWRPREERESGNNGVWWYDSIVGYLCTVLDDREFPDDAILSDDNMIAYGCCLDDAIRTDVNVVSNFHWVIVEVAAVGFVWWPHDAPLPNETVSAQRYNHGMSWSCSSEVSSDDCTTRNDGLSSQDDVLWSSYRSSARDLVACVCFNELCFRVVNWCVHLASCRRNASARRQYPRWY